MVLYRVINDISTLRKILFLFSPPSVRREVKRLSELLLLLWLFLLRHFLTFSFFRRILNEIYRPVFRSEVFISVFQASILTSELNSDFVIFVSEILCFKQAASNGPNIDSITPVTSVWACQEECLKYENCVEFDFVISWKTCWIKYAMGDKVQGIDHWIGGRNCLFPLN